MALAGSLAVALAGAADWQKVSAGPFEVYFDHDGRGAKSLLGTLEQLRQQLTDLAGIADPKPLFPIRVVVAKGQRSGNLTETTNYYHLLTGEPQLTVGQYKQLVNLFLATNAGPMEPSLEAALVSVLARIDSTGARVTLGVVPPAAEQTPDWVLLEYLITNDLYRGRLRVYLGNLMRGTEKAVALRNGFEKDEATLRAEAAAARGKFAPVTYAAKPILPERDYRARDVENDLGQLELALAQLGDGRLRDDARRTCSTLAGKNPEALACVAAAYALAGQKELAAQEAEKALVEQPKNPRLLYLAALGQADRVKHQQYLFTALQLKPVYPAAAREFAAKENDPVKALQAMKAAAGAAQRDIQYQVQLAKVAEMLNNFGDANKAWGAAERAAWEPAERERLHKARLDSTDRRLEEEARERREAEEAKRRDIERVKQESLARVRAAEAKVNAKLQPLEPGEKVAEWWDGAQPDAVVSGLLTRVECLGGGKARFEIKEEGGKATMLSSDKPGQIVVSGSGANEFTFICGVQKAARKVKAGYQKSKGPGAAGVLLSLELLP